jgi:predicted nucleotidyltransferase component of viral defense system
VRYRTPDRFRAALDERLRCQAASGNVPLMRLRKVAAFERWLARMAVAAPRRWVLKGAFALQLRLGARMRSTKDIDLGRADDETAMAADVASAETVDLGDYFTFATECARALDARYTRAVRYRVTAELDGRIFDRFRVDVVLGEAPGAEPEWLPGPNLLAFEIPVVPLEQHVAEKLHAYTATYGAAGVESTRPKDLVDLLLVRSLTSPDAAQLREACRRTFVARAGQPMPEALREPPAVWAGRYARLAREVGLPADLRTGHARAAALLDPVLQGRAAGRWDPGAGRWAGPFNP